MPSPATDKVLLTNLGVLKAKYGSAYATTIKPAIDALIAADKARGIITLLIALDNATTMKKYSGKAVKDPLDPKQNKQAVDAVCKKLTPSYVCLLGSVDVIPQQPLINPLPGDGDANVPSDLPYACDQPFGDRIEDFLAPSRVVGRLPDLTGGKDAFYLAGLLNTAALAKSRPAIDYQAYLGLTAKVWDASTSLSLKNTFGSSMEMQSVPPKAPPWTGKIDRLSHFINCHGAAASTQFFGQQGTSYPVAHDATKLVGLREATVASVECCYGAELYNPALTGGQPGICNTYLQKKAYGFFGSSNIAYGPSSGNGAADLLCQYFLQAMVKGSSLGLAVLQARLDFIKSLSIADPADLKTIAQFSLMGDPSIHPVASVPGGHSVIPAGTTKAVIKAIPSTAGDIVNAASRLLRRQHLTVLGKALASAVAVVETASKVSAKGTAKALLEREMAQIDAVVKETSTFLLRQPKVVGMKALSMQTGSAGVDSVHVAIGELPSSSLFRRLCIITARKQGDQYVMQRLFSR